MTGLRLNNSVHAGTRLGAATTKWSHKYLVTLTQTTRDGASRSGELSTRNLLPLDLVWKWGKQIQNRDEGRFYVSCYSPLNMFAVDLTNRCTHIWFLVIATCVCCVSLSQPVGPKLPLSKPKIFITTQYYLLYWIIISDFRFLHNNTNTLFPFPFMRYLTKFRIPWGCFREILFSELWDCKYPPSLAAQQQ